MLIKGAIRVDCLLCTACNGKRPSDPDLFLSRSSMTVKSVLALRRGAAGTWSAAYQYYSTENGPGSVSFHASLCGSFDRQSLRNYFGRFS